MRTSGIGLLLLESLLLVCGAVPVLAQKRVNPAVARPKDAPYPIDIRQLRPLNRLVQPTGNGYFRVRIIVNEAGRVWFAEALNGGDAGLVSSILDEVLQLRFEPWRVEGRPVPVRGTITLGSWRPSGETAESDAAPPKREAIRVGGNTANDRLLKRVEPVYPKEAIAVRISGTVILQVTVNEGGRVYEATVLRGQTLLNRAAIDAVLQWQYRPLLLNGEPCPFIAVVTLTFRLPR